MDKYEEYIEFLKKEEIFESTVGRQMCKESFSVISDILNEKKPKKILEIGRDRGFSFGFLKFCSPDSYVVSVDPYPKKQALEVAKRFDDNYKFIDDASPHALLDVEDIFDFVIIDGDHRYESCLADWKGIQKNISKGSIVLFDDLDANPKQEENICGKVFFDLKGVDKKAYEVHGSPAFGIVFI